MTVEQNRDDHQYDAPSQGAWRPIETAPRDESFVLLYVPHQQLETGPVVMGMHWRAEPRGEDGKFKKGRWYHVGNGWLGVEADLRPAWCEPTHWMPLPAPPHGGPMTDDPITGTAST